MTGGTSNIVRIFGSTYADYGVQPNGPDRDTFAEAGCVDRWDMFDSDASAGETVELMRTICANCPALDHCAKSEDVKTVYDIHGFRAGKTRDERRAEYRGQEYTRPRAALTDDQWHAEFRTGDPIATVAARIGMSASYVGENRRRLGYHGGQGASKPTTEPINNRARDRAFKALYMSGHSIAQAAHQMGTSRPMAERIRRRLIDAGAEFPARGNW